MKSSKNRNKVDIGYGSCIRLNMTLFIEIIPRLRSIMFARLLKT